MSTIGDLSVTNTVGSTDKLPVWSDANSVTRALPISVLDSRYVVKSDINLVALSATSQIFTSSGVESPTTFIPGSTQVLVLQNLYYTVSNLEVFFDGTYQGTDQYTLSAYALSFSSPIPVGVGKVYIRGGATMLTAVPPDRSIGDSQLSWGITLGRVVDSVAQMQLLDPLIYKRIFATGYYRPGDGGGGSYYYDSAISQASANGGTIITALGGIGCYMLEHSGVVPLTVFGAVADNSTDSTSAIQNAITAFQGSKGKLIVNGRFVITSALTVTGAINLEGYGPTASGFRQTTATANGLNVTFLSFSSGTSLAGFSIEAGSGYVSSGFTGTGSSGIGLNLKNINTQGTFSNVTVANFSTGISNGGNWSLYFENIFIYYFSGAGLLVSQQGSGGDGRYNGVTISNNGFTGDNSASIGVEIASTGGEYFNQVEVVSSNVGWGIYPAVGYQVTYLWFNQCLGDTNLHNAWDIVATAGILVSCEMTNCWGAFSSVGAGLSISGGNIQSVRWNGGRLRENGGPGVAITTGGGVYIDSAEIASNSRGSPNVNPGVVVAGGSSNWAVMNCRIGNFASGSSDQGWGIIAGPGAATHVRVINNDLTNSGAGTGGFNNLATLTNSIVTPNIS